MMRHGQKKDYGTFSFFLNGEGVEVRGADAFRMTARFLRERLAKTGTKIVCEEGDCGACTALFRSRLDGGFKAVDTCILPVYALEGGHLVTVEGLKFEDRLHPVQQAMVEHFGSQCGYCTPGVVCSLVALVDDSISEKRKINLKRAKNYLTGNLCRCTGYEPIIAAAVNVDLREYETLRKRYPQISKKPAGRVEVLDGGRSLYLPVTLKDALSVRKKIPGIRIIGGATDLGVAQTKGKFEPEKLISLQNVMELYKVKRDKSGITIGARVTLARLEEVVRRDYPEFANLLRIFASPQIKNLATLVGNTVNASPIADTTPFLMAADAEVLLQSSDKKRKVPISEFYLGYKKVDVSEQEIVTGIHIPRAKIGTVFKLYKVSTRKDLDISTATFAARLLISDNKILDCRLVMGGVGPVVLRLTKLEKEWLGRKFSDEVVAEIGQKLSREIKPISDMRGSANYRLNLGTGFFKRLKEDVGKETL